MKFSKTKLAAAFAAAALLGVTTCASAASFFVRVPVAPNAQISNGGIPDGAGGSGDTGGVSKPATSPSAAVEVDMGSPGTSDPANINCSYDGPPGMLWLNFASYDGSAPVTSTITIPYACANNSSTPYTMHVSAAVSGTDNTLACYAGATSCGLLAYSLETSTAEFVIPAHDNYYSGTLTVNATIPAGQSVSGAANANYSDAPVLTLNYN